MTRRTSAPPSAPADNSSRSAAGLPISQPATGPAIFFVVDPTSGQSAIILESRNSPAVLETSGVIKLTGDHSGITLGVSDSRLAASFDSNGDIQWNFSEPRSDFASLQPGQISVLNFLITLRTDRSTTEIPVKVSIYDVDQPVVSVADAAPVVPEPVAAETASAEAKPAEPEMIEVWRPGRPPEERRPPRPPGERHERRERRPRPAQAAQPAAAAAAPPEGAAPADAAASAAPREAKPDERPRHGRDRVERPDRPEREARPQQRERRGGDRPERQDRGERPRQGRRDFKDRDQIAATREWRDPKERRGGRSNSLRQARCTERAAGIHLRPAQIASASTNGVARAWCARGHPPLAAHYGPGEAQWRTRDRNEPGSRRRRHGRSTDRADRE